MTWRVIVIDELEVDPQIREFPSQEALVIFLRTLSDTSWAMPFYGALLRFTNKSAEGLRYLVGLDGTRIPLFEIEPELEVSDSFYLGESPPDASFDPFAENFSRQPPTSATARRDDNDDDDDYDEMAENQDENPVESDEDRHYPDV